MEITLATRKPITDLTPDDLEAFPIWEFADDEESVPGRDETWIRPVDAKAIADGAFSLTVAAKVITSSGRSYSGFVGCSVFGGLDVNVVGILDQGKYLLFRNNPLFPELNANAAAELGLPETAVFPLRYMLCVPLEGLSDSAEGTIP